MGEESVSCVFSLEGKGECPTAGSIMWVNWECARGVQMHKYVWEKAADQPIPELRNMWTAIELLLQLCYSSRKKTM